jgi:hypothetical protein
MPTPQEPQQQQTNRPQQGQTQQPAQGGQQQQGGGRQQQTPQPPNAPGGGALTNPLFSGDHVLETVATGNGALKEGASGPAVRAIQKFLVGQGLNVGRTGADGQWGRVTTAAVKQWQTSHGQNPDGVIGKDTLIAMDKAPAAPVPVAAPPGGAQAPQPDAQGGGAAGAAPPPAGGATSGDFSKMWDAHPHNSAGTDGQNTKSSDLLADIGLPTDWNTCAIRMSVMLNKIGQRITLQKVKAAGIARAPYFSKKTKQYYILAAKEMWTYLSKTFRKADVVFPKSGKPFKDGDEFRQSFDEDIKPLVQGRKGIVAFEKIFTYSGTGHVDLFDGEALSDSDMWYPSMRLHIWYCDVPNDRGIL